jgi:hypothetical protein
MAVPFVHSGYERKPDDDYQTVDPRCLQALLDTWEIDGTIVDCCGRHGSQWENEILFKCRGSM